MYILNTLYSTCQWTWSSLAAWWERPGPSCPWLPGPLVGIGYTQISNQSNAWLASCCWLLKYCTVTIFRQPCDIKVYEDNGYFIFTVRVYVFCWWNSESLVIKHRTKQSSGLLTNSARISHKNLKFNTTDFSDILQAFLTKISYCIKYQRFKLDFLARVSHKVRLSFRT